MNKDTKQPKAAQPPLEGTGDSSRITIQGSELPLDPDAEGGNDTEPEDDMVIVLVDVRLVCVLDLPEFVVGLQSGRKKPLGPFDDPFKNNS